LVRWTSTRAGDRWNTVARSSTPRALNAPIAAFAGPGHVDSGVVSWDGSGWLVTAVGTRTRRRPRGTLAPFSYELGKIPVSYLPSVILTNRRELRTGDDRAALDTL